MRRRIYSDLMWARRRVSVIHVMTRNPLSDPLNYCALSERLVKIQRGSRLGRKGGRIRSLGAISGRPESTWRERPKDARLLNRDFVAAVNTARSRLPREEYHLRPQFRRLGNAIWEISINYTLCYTFVSVKYK